HNYFFRSFFIQAEDGIRDRNVTGVQTCALPISCSETLNALLISKLIFPISTYPFLSFSYSMLNFFKERFTIKCITFSSSSPEYRSEERRVGKECRVRGLWHDLKSNHANY